MWCACVVCLGRQVPVGLYYDDGRAEVKQVQKVALERFHYDTGCCFARAILVD